MSEGAAEFIEDLQRSADRQTTNELYHYTSGDVAIYSILRSGQLRLSPFESTNDLWESRPLHPTLSSHDDNQDALRKAAGDRSEDLWTELDRKIRLQTKVGCFTEDVALSPDAFEPDALRGWGHLSLWAHYGQAHSGVCLRFDRKRLLEAFHNEQWPGALKFYDQVRYWQSPRTTLDEIDIGQVLEFGADAVALGMRAAMPIPCSSVSTSTGQTSLSIASWSLTSPCCL